ncbi:hypothetical protein D3OALGB2SA_4506 [Olavius algarvensis associated proteobacterium Delta 3]|nr:hypothetical protein D3OALGB2SA_4506 [Olavius algarvensis associated proteobacterium Delta 3]
MRIRPEFFVWETVRGAVLSATAVGRKTQGGVMVPVYII